MYKRQDENKPLISSRLNPTPSALITKVSLSKSSENKFIENDPLKFVSNSTMEKFGRVLTESVISLSVVSLGPELSGNSTAIS